MMEHRISEDLQEQVVTEAQATMLLEAGAIYACDEHSIECCSDGDHTLRVYHATAHGWDEIDRLLAVPVKLTQAGR